MSEHEQEQKLEAALAEAMRDLEAGRFHRESVADHIELIKADLRGASDQGPESP